MKKIILAVAVWYFIAYNNAGLIQVGPFATQAACENYQNIAESQNITALPCFSTTAK